MRKAVKRNSTLGAPSVWAEQSKELRRRKWISNVRGLKDKAGRLHSADGVAA